MGAMADRASWLAFSGIGRALSLAPALLLAPLLAACGDAAAPGGGCASECGPTVSMDFSPGAADFFSAPFPSDTRLLPDGHVDLAGFPLGKGIDLVHRTLDLLGRDARGFGLTSGLYFKLSAPLDPSSLPDLHGSVKEGSPLFLIGVSKGAPDYLRRYPVTARFQQEAGMFGSENLLSLVPLQGVPLRPKSRYAAVLLRTLRGQDGRALQPAPALGELLQGRAPEGMSETAFATYAEALSALGEAGIDTSALAGLGAFTTDDPLEAFGKVNEAMLSLFTSEPSVPFARNELFDDFCVYESRIPLPVYQRGEPPYSQEGGDWAFDAQGAPVLQRMEEAHFVVTLPRRPMPEAGYPLVVMSRTGGGGDRPLVDRGVQAMTGGPALVPGTGPALYFAQAGFAGVSVDGPHGGLRNITQGDEQFLMFNVGNPAALRDNVRQSAAELVLLAHVLETLSLDVADCPGATAPLGKARFDTATMALMGHSMGASIAPLTLAFEPRYRAGLLSGAGGSMIENVMYKEHPLVVKGFAEILVGLAGTGESLSERDPLLNLFQWAAEAADSPPYGERILAAPVDGPPRHVLMMQGIVDHYILPPIANATSLSLGLDLAGDALDEKHPELTHFAPLGSLLDLVGRSQIPLPASGNRVIGDDTVTAVVIQYPEDGIEDGREVVFQTEAPKHQYRCFLEGLAKGKPRVPSAGKVGDPCE